MNISEIRTEVEFEKNQEISLTIEDFTKEGEGLGKYQGFPFFVKDTVIGDEVRVSITKLKRITVMPVW